MPSSDLRFYSMLDVESLPETDIPGVFRSLDIPYSMLDIEKEVASFTDFPSSMLE